jgi:hypothetical protein
MEVDSIVGQRVKACWQNQEEETSNQAIVHVVLLVVDCTVEKRDAAAKLRLFLHPGYCFTAAQMEYACSCFEQQG